MTRTLDSGQFTCPSGEIVQGIDIEIDIHKSLEPPPGTTVTTSGSNSSTSSDYACIDRWCTIKRLLCLIVVICCVTIPTLLWYFQVFTKNDSSNGNDPSTTNNNGSTEAPPDLVTITQDQRQLYYDYLLQMVPADTTLALTDTSSPEARALEWLAFEDTDVDLILMTIEPKSKTSVGTSGDDNDAIQRRILQRFALLVLYYSTGGTQFWKVMNADPTSGWIEYGQGIHECFWNGIDCQNFKRQSSSTGIGIDNDDTTLSASGEEEDSHNNDDDDWQHVVSGIRLAGGFGITLTGPTLPTQLGLLTHLEVLNLEHNRLEGTLPTEWKSLTNLSK